MNTNDNLDNTIVDDDNNPCYVCICVCVCVYIYIYIYIGTSQTYPPTAQASKEADRVLAIFGRANIYIYIYIYIHIFVYKCIHTHREPLV